MVYTEFVSADALIRSVGKTQQKLNISDEERPVAIQIYGRDTATMVEAARIVEQAHPDTLDINFGCPVKRVAGKGAGAGMLQNIPLMLEITRAVVDAVKIPVTVKTRLGWDANSKIIVDLAEQLQQLGDKHSRHTIKSRTTFFMNRGQHNQRVETFYHHLCTTMSQTVHGSQYYPKTMEQRNATTKFVICRELHVFPRQKSIIGDIIMCQHHPFRAS